MFKKEWETLAAEAGYRPRELARLCHVSIRTLQRKFSREYGMTLGEWLRDLRLKLAYRRITEGEPVKVVAYDLGFKQLSHFSKAFKQFHGVPPSSLSNSGRKRLASLFNEPSLLAAPLQFAPQGLAECRAGARM